MKRKLHVKFEYNSYVTYISNLGFIDGKDNTYTDSIELRLQPYLNS